jgi:hypothetical protein
MGAFRQPGLPGSSSSLFRTSGSDVALSMSQRLGNVILFYNILCVLAHWWTDSMKMNFTASETVS